MTEDLFHDLICKKLWDGVGGFFLGGGLPPVNETIFKSKGDKFVQHIFRFR